MKVFLEMINWGIPLLDVGENPHSCSLLPGHGDVKSCSVSRLPCHDEPAPLETLSHNKKTFGKKLE